MSCIFFRTRVPAALLPPLAFCTSGSASTTSCFNVSNSCIDASMAMLRAKTVLARGEGVNWGGVVMNPSLGTVHEQLIVEQAFSVRQHVECLLHNQPLTPR